MAIGGPTIVVQISELRLLVDPTFSPPGEYESAPGRTLAKLTGPAMNLDDVGDVDAVLLSHFTEGAAELRHAFGGAGLAERLFVLEPGRLAQL